MLAATASAFFDAFLGTRTNAINVHQSKDSLSMAPAREVPLKEGVSIITNRGHICSRSGQQMQSKRRPAGLDDKKTAERMLRRSVIVKSAYWTVMTPFMFNARCGTQWYGYWPGLMLPNETVIDSPGFIFRLLESSPILSVPMLASSCALTSAGIVAGSNATLCGPPLTTTNFTPSPCLMVKLAGSKR